MKSSVIFFLVLDIIFMVNGSKILIVFSMYSPSHAIIGNALTKGLANAGHDVTLVSSVPPKIETKKGSITNVALTGMAEAVLDSNIISWKDIGEVNPFHFEYIIGKLGNLITNYTLSHPNFKELLKSKEKFDVIILEQFFNDGLKALSCHFKAPLIDLNTVGATFSSNSQIGNPSPISYIPDVSLSYSSKMNFLQRTINTVFTVVKYIHRELIFLPNQAQLIKEHLPECYPEFYQLFYNVSLSFINAHESTTHAQPLVPNMIPIGGFYIEPPKKLPEDLQKFMDDAKEGVIYFSLGSNIIGSHLGDDMKRTLLKALGKLKQKVLWKWDEDIKEAPQNIKLQKWFPQQSILAHPNLKLFITHGGLLSTTETIYHGVPVLSIPFFADQKLNAAKMEADGYGLTISLEDITEERLSKTLEELLNDSKYQDNAKKRSLYLRDRPVQPMDLAVYWTEFIIRHKGAPHLRVAGLDLEWYQYYLLDVIASIAASISIVLVVIYYLFKTLLRKIRKSNKVKVN